MEIEKKAARKIQINRQLAKIERAEYFRIDLVGLARVVVVRFHKKDTG